MHKSIVDLLVCPACKGKLVFSANKNELICRFHKVAFTINNNVPIMIFDKARKLTSEDN